MFFGQQIAKLFQRAPCILSGVRLFDAMMKMDLNFAVPLSLQRGEHVENRSFVLFSREKVCVTKRSTVVIANGATGSSGQLAPRFHARQRFWSQSRLEVIGHEKDQMAGLIRLG